MALSLIDRARGVSGQDDAEAPVVKARRSVRRARLLARAPRITILALAAILAIAGLRAALFGVEAKGTASDVPEADRAAEALAVRFARAYLSFDAERPALREREIRALVGNGMDPDAGFIPAGGAQDVLWAEVAQNQRALVGGRLLVVEAGVSSRREPVYLSVPVDRDGEGQVYISGYPALVGQPASRAAQVDEDLESVEQGAIETLAKRGLRNYLVGSMANLRADLAEGAEVALPTVPLELAGVESMRWSADGTAVLATVFARSPEGTHTMTYEVGVAAGADRDFISYIHTIPNAA